MKMRHRRARFNRRTVVVSLKVPTWVIDRMREIAGRDKNRSYLDVMADALKQIHENLKETSK
ncbi:hypothetical protein [uncultured Aquabacterium sp.]|uniref:hypothetical protein n=1 Tax=uncultured Aquabacterium sp. TaxID=158753 RepID=UPI0025EF4B55|nr:hypothetical protein [uncultured Aquabacterium sp.]